MAGEWLDVAGEGDPVGELRRWLYQYAKVDDRFVEKFPNSPGEWGTGVAVGDEVVRRRHVKVISWEWRGLTKAAADLKAAELYTSTAWGAIRIRKHPGGNHVVSSDETIYTSFNWTRWWKVEDLDKLATDYMYMEIG